MTERVLYHFENSPFSRRARLALAHKGLTVELRDPRVEPSYGAELAASSPIGTAPVLLDQGRRVIDSGALFTYLDLAYPEAPRLFPTDRAELALELEVTTLVDAALDPIVDLGSRYFDLSSHASWTSVVADRKARVDRSLARLADIYGTAATSPRAWGAADICTYAAVAWLEALPGRLGQHPNIERILALGVTTPKPLLDFRRTKDDRADVRAIYART
jgi:glutathione S-transferase